MTKADKKYIQELEKLLEVKRGQLEDSLEKNKELTKYNNLLFKRIHRLQDHIGYLFYVVAEEKVISLQTHGDRKEMDNRLGNI